MADEESDAQYPVPPVSKGLDESLSPYKLAKLEGAAYVPNAFTAEVAKLLYDNSIQDKGKGTYRGISGTEGPKVAPYSRTFPPWLATHVIQPLLQRKLLLQPPFQISVNNYVSSDKGIVPHKDGSGDRVVIVTLAAPAVLDFYHIVDRYFPHTRVYTDEQLLGKTKVSVYLEPSSLLVLTGPSFIDYAHHIVPQVEDTITEELINHHLLAHPIGTTVPRCQRVSMAVWSD